MSETVFPNALHPSTNRARIQSLTISSAETTAAIEGLQQYTRAIAKSTALAKYFGTAAFAQSFLVFALWNKAIAPQRRTRRDRAKQAAHNAGKQPTLHQGVGCGALQR
jgi:hypothetical protein